MAKSGIVWIDVIFDWCVIFLHDTAHLIGISYEEINVWLFVIITPILFFFSVGLNVYLVKKIKRINREN